MDALLRSWLGLSIDAKRTRSELIADQLANRRKFNSSRNPGEPSAHGTHPPEHRAAQQKMLEQARARQAEAAREAARQAKEKAAAESDRAQRVARRAGDPPNLSLMPFSGAGPSRPPPPDDEPAPDTAPKAKAKREPVPVPEDFEPPPTAQTGGTWFRHGTIPHPMYQWKWGHVKAGVDRYSPDDLGYSVTHTVAGTHSVYTFASINPDSVPWKDDLQLEGDARYIVVVWKQEGKGGKSKWVPWTMINESEAVRRVKTQDGNPLPPTHGLYALKTFAKPRDKTTGIGSGRVEQVIGFYSGTQVGELHKSRKAAAEQEARLVAEGRNKLVVTEKRPKEKGGEVMYGLIDAGANELPPFLSYANDPRGTGLTAKAIVYPSLRMIASKGIKKFDFDTTQLKEAAESEILWSYDPSYWARGNLQQEGSSSEEEEDDYATARREGRSPS